MKDRPIALPLMLPLVLLGAAVLAPSAPAQRGGFASRGATGAMSARGGAMSARGGGGIARRGGMVARGGASARPMRPRGAGRYLGNGRYLGAWGDAGLFYPDYDAGYDYGPALEPPPLEVIGVQTAPAASPAPPPAKPAEAMVLELEGDRWVRITPYGPPQAVAQAAAPSSSPERAPNARPETPAAVRGPATAAARPPAPLPPAVLVFRDGHQEQIGQYRIMGANLYLNTDYWSSGAWTRTIPLADLDIPATLKLNQQRGANFRLPSGPNEVMIGG